MRKNPTTPTCPRARAADVLALTLALAFAATALAAATEDPYVKDTLKRCKQAADYLADSKAPGLEWDDWVVSGSHSGSSRRFPEKRDPYVPHRVTVEYIRTEGLRAQSLTGVRPDGTSWMIWYDKQGGCALLTGSPSSMSGDGATLTAEAGQRVFKRGEDLNLVLAPDTSERAEDETNRINGQPCDDDDNCNSDNCDDGFCRP